MTIHASPNGLNINVDAGSEHIRRSPDEMNLLVQPSKGFRCASADTELSMERITVVPTAQTFLFASMARFTAMR